MGSAGDQRSHRESSSNAEEHRLFCRRAFAGWPVSVSPRDTGRFNAETFWEFLKGFREARTVPGRRVLAIRDNAPYHRPKLHLGWRDPQAPGLALDFLPPYSPDLNPIERVWKLTRRLCLHHRYFGLLDGVVAAVEGQFAEWNQTQ